MSVGNNWKYPFQNVSHVIDYGQYSQYVPNSGDDAWTQQVRLAQLQNFAAASQQGLGQRSIVEGHKPVVVCGSVVENCKDMEDAQRKAEELAHKHGANAYILKPVRMVAPKRDVVTTDLP